MFYLMIVLTHLRSECISKKVNQAIHETEYKEIDSIVGITSTSNTVFDTRDK